MPFRNSCQWHTLKHFKCLKPSFPVVDLKFFFWFICSSTLITEWPEKCELLSKAWENNSFVAEIWNYSYILLSYYISTTVSYLFKQTSYHYHYHYHVVPQARIYLTHSRHLSLSFIASGRSSGLHPVSSHNCSKYVRAGRPAFSRPYVGVHRSTSLTSSSLFLQQCPACLVRLTWIVFVMRVRSPYSWCLVGCCWQDLFSIARNILM